MASPSKDPDRWIVPAVSAEALLAADAATVVDLRSPGEFAEDHLPGALNRPLFDDQERALVGTLYKQTSPEAAFDHARGLVLEGVGSLVGGLAEAAGRPHPGGDLTALVERLTEDGLEGSQRALRFEPARELPEGALVVHCWRGGMRSASVARLLRELGWERVFVLEGGYKSYRKRVLAELEAWQAPPSFVLRGMTGVGKTLVLRALEELRPGWTLDLEGLAGHRSSILGMVGLEPCNQKTFDSRLATRLREGFTGPCVIEGESRKVGDSIVPASVWRALREGTHLRLEAPLARRVEVLVEDYLAEESSRDELRRQLPFIEERLGRTRWGGELVARLDDGREAELVEILLERYYDPLYSHSERDYAYSETFDTTDPVAAATAIAEWIEARPGGMD
jgi:tRNA 2-selenouridine synthase